MTEKMVDKAAELCDKQQAFLKLTNDWPNGTDGKPVGLTLVATDFYLYYPCSYCPEYHLHELTYAQAAIASTMFKDGKEFMSKSIVAAWKYTFRGLF